MANCHHLFPIPNSKAIVSPASYTSADACLSSSVWVQWLKVVNNYSHCFAGIVLYLTWLMMRSDKSCWDLWLKMGMAVSCYIRLSLKPKTTLGCMCYFLWKVILYILAFVLLRKPHSGRNSSQCFQSALLAQVFSEKSQWWLELTSLVKVLLTRTVHIFPYTRDCQSQWNAILFTTKYKTM